MFIDTHCHLNYAPLWENIDRVLDEAAAVGVGKILCIGTDIESSQKALRLAEKYPQIYAAAGVHPNDSALVKAGWQMELLQLCGHEKVVAVGEVGLDYYRDHAGPETQIRCFSEQIDLAKELGLPLVIHNRRADEDVKLVLIEHHYTNAVLHCYSGDAEYARAMIELGLHISFTGNVTYGSRKTERAVQAVPIDRLMLETDAPYITPVPHKGESNQPAFIPLIAAKVAELKAVSIAEVETATTENAIQFFQLPR